MTTPEPTDPGQQVAPDPIGPVATGARCDHENCDTDVGADYLARNWEEAAGLHARDLRLAGWHIEHDWYLCPTHAESDRMGQKQPWWLLECTECGSTDPCPHDRDEASR